MNKKYYLNLLTMMMVAMLSVGFTACGDDDDDVTGVAGVESLYGSWQQTRGVAYEDGDFHHEKKVSADDAEYLRFDKDGNCTVMSGDYGVFDQNGTFSFSFNEESKSLRAGYQTFVVDGLSNNTLKLKYMYSSDEYILATYKKVSDNVWEKMPQ